MPLISIFETAPESVAKFSIEQVVATAGDGALKDDSTCSAELREYLGKVGTVEIARYVDHCLSVPFQKNGMVLQDLVNELGRRLDYVATNGRYQGVQGKIGFDGLWRSPEGHTLVVEVKTTDAYRLSLDTFATYRARLAEAGKLTPESSILIVVGRQDTGELEAQIRGSRHAWDIRVISVESLIKLVLLKENTEAAETGLKMRSLLTPIEYTRLDRMVDVMFTTATDVEEEPEPDEQAGDAPVSSSSAIEIAKASPPIVTAADLATTGKGTWHFTDAQLLQAKREDVIAALGRREIASLVRKSRALYWNAQRDVRAACSMSKRYTGKNQAPYWYAYHPQWDTFLGEADRGFFVLGCMDLETAFAVPHATIKPLLPSLHTTTNKSGTTYWHVHLIEHGDILAISIPKSTPLDLSPYQMSVS
ncbi:MAG TPA: hypothetical protein VF638_01345 [Sphingomonas sp.]|jgi:hypothetical protein